MNKKEQKSFLSNLKKLSKHLVDIESNTAITFLEEKLKSLNVDEEIKKEMADLPVPEPLIGKMFGYAVYSDGGCRQNPGPGAWGALAQNAQGELLFEKSDGELETTNNRMELTGAIEGLRTVSELIEEKGESVKDNDIFLVTDSQYVVKGLNEWMAGWKRRGWKKADRKEPENIDLWKKLDELKADIPQLKALWVKGHNGHPQNERCDELANIYMDSFQL